MTGSSHTLPGAATGFTEPASRAPRLLDTVRARVRRLGLSRRTEEAYVGWIRCFIFANVKRHRGELGGREVEAFLTALVTKANVVSSTQNQTLSALPFLYREVLAIDLPWMENICGQNDFQWGQDLKSATRGPLAVTCAPH